MPTALDLGIRYILPFYVTFAIAGAATVLAMMRASHVTAAIAVLLVCQLGASALAHPDYFAYFNAVAGSDPSRYLVDSNVDWGQDILRLRDVVRRKQMPSLAISLTTRLSDFRPCTTLTRGPGHTAVSPSAITPIR
jgi:hypothetical protein